MNSKLLPTILLAISLFFSLLLSANNFCEEDWQFSSTATGNTTGYIGDLTITNTTSSTNTMWLKSYIIPPVNGQQGYAVLKGEVEQVEIQPGAVYVHKLQGYCINVDLPPATKGASFPNFSTWLSLKDYDTFFAESWYQTDNKPATLNFNTQLEKAAPIIAEAVVNLEEQYSTWKSPLQIPDIYPGNANRVEEAIIQQAVWQFTSALQGKTYNFNTFEQSILKQEAIKTWLNLNATENIIVDDSPINKKIYFNYQCQKLWTIINELNFYVNPSSRKLLPKWESNMGDLETTNIEFQEPFEEVLLIGNYFKPKQKEKFVIAPETKEKTKRNKKALPFIIGGVGAAGIATGIVLLTNKEKGCTDANACNFNEAAEKDDGSCNYEDCLGRCGGNAVMGTACNDGDETTVNDTYNFACECIGISINGCLDATACNYNSSATVDDGSCDYGDMNCPEPCSPIVGCTKPTACNYNSDACIDDGNCRFIRGCTDAMFCNYNPEACIDDSSCIAPPCNEVNCNLKEGTIRFNECGPSSISNCQPNPYYLIEYEEILLDPNFDLVGNCFRGYEGQKILFDYNVIPEEDIDTTFFTCTEIATPIYLTCLEINTEECTYERVTIEVNKCDCNESSYAFLKTENEEIIEFYFSDSCENQTFKTGEIYNVDYGISNLKPSCSVADELAFVNCIEKVECSDPCDPNCLKTGIIRLNENCLTGINRGCKEIPQYLIEYNGKLLTADLNSGDKCFYGYDGQVINFNFEVVPEDEIDDSYICSNIAVPVKITCLEIISGNCESEEAELIGINCACFDNRNIAFFKVGAEILEFITSDCSSSDTTFPFGNYILDYYDAGIEPGCSIADRLVIVTCYKLQPSAKNNEPKQSEYKINNLTPFIENRVLSIPVQNSEYPETVMTTTVFGINYYKPLSTDVFIQNQTAVGSLLSSNMYFLNNKSTINFRNPYFPLHYGLGLNNQQLTDFVANANWQTDVIWNIGLTLPLLKKLQLEAELFKAFNINEHPNYNIRLIYRNSKPKENLETKKF